MKKHLSVFALFARSSIYKVLIILFVMAVTETILFCIQFQNSMTYYDFDLGTGMIQLERLIDRSFIPQTFATSFLLITVCLCLPGTEYTAQSGYTLRRLSINEHQIFYHQAAYNILIVLLLLAVQIALSFGICSYYASCAPADTVGAQTVFLAFYRNEFLHSLFPLSEIALWIRNGFLVTALGFAAAEFPYKQRRRTFGGAIIAILLFAVVFFRNSIGDGQDITMSIIVSLMIMAEVIYTLYFKEALNEI